MKRLALVLIAAFALASLPAGAGARPDVVRTCNHKLDFNLKITSARNMRCRAARRVMRRHRKSIAPHFNAPNGFHCDLVRGSGSAASWRCTRGGKAFRFLFGD